MSLDYSKWDKLVADLSDEESPDRRRPQVTAFDKPSSVTIPGSGEIKVNCPPSNPAPSRSQPISTKNLKPEEKAINLRGKSFSENGGEFEGYSWSQTGDEVTVSAWIPVETRAKMVSVSVDGESRSFAVKLQGKPIVSGQLAFGVEMDEDFEGGVEWELKDFESRRRVVVTLVKKSPIKGAKVWWNRLLTSEAKIDTRSMKGRKKGSVDMAKLWEEAHRMFRDKVSKQKPTYLDDDGNVVPNYAELLDSKR